MIIAQISDTHILAKSSAHAMAASRAENLRQCVADINRQGVDVVVHTGDSVQDGIAEEYAHLRGILADLEAPLFLIPGNRDRHDALRSALDHFSYLPMNGDFLHYVIEDYPMRLVALDSVVTGERKGVFCARRLAWLEETLSQEPHRPTLLFMHHPPFDIEPHYVGGYRNQQEANDLAAAISRHSQVKRLLCGHVHFMHRAPWGGAEATTMPSVAVDLRKTVGEVIDEAIEEAPLYLLHVVSNDGSLVSRTRVVTH
ncbi:MAG: phosphodiesterase [Rhodospirillaceae bacterium]|jgi:3',5'-cyclic AMP phosphodiesterase CpdA|nr:phosphodiesterase [Rhodospirillaceae bacterium]MBT5457049.1 phosphodiesterase [Rhodospirillaceae bacterium]